MTNATLTFLARLTIWATFGIVAALGATILMGLATRSINSRYMLYGRDGNGNPYFSPERVQLLVATIAVSISFLVTSASTTNGQMPTLPTPVLGLIGASSAIYLGGKGLTTIQAILNAQVNSNTQDKQT